MQTILIQTFPNREVRVTLTREKPAGRFTYDEPETPTLTSVQNSEPGLIAQNPQPGDKLESSKQASSTSRPGFGLLPKVRAFSMYARRQLWRAGGAFDSTFAHNTALFLTATVPGSTVAAFKAVAEWSSWIVDRLKSWLSKRGASAYSLYCWEWQKRGALHLHYVCQSDDQAVANSIKRDFQNEWIRLIDGVSRHSGVDVWRKNDRYTHAGNKSVVQTRVEVVQKSVAAYLAKYLSKAYKPGKNSVQKFFCPTRWSGISRPLNALTKSLSTEERISTLTDRQGFQRYYDALSLLQNTALKCQEYSHKVGSGKTVIAYVSNSIKGEVCQMLNAILTSQVANSFESSQRLDLAVKRGLILMNGNMNWRQLFTDNCGSYVHNLALKSYNSQPLTPLDQMHLLDALAFSLTWLLKTRSAPSGLESAWLNLATSVINDASGVSSRSSVPLSSVKNLPRGVDDSAESEYRGTTAVTQSNPVDASRERVYVQLPLF